MGLLDSLFGTKCTECKEVIKGEKFPALSPGWLCQSCYLQLETERKQKDEERRRQTARRLFFRCTKGQSEAKLEEAIQAVVRIGDRTTVEVLRAELKSRGWSEIALEILKRINSPESRQALEDHRREEERLDEEAKQRAELTKVGRQAKCPGCGKPIELEIVTAVLGAQCHNCEFAAIWCHACDDSFMTISFRTSDVPGVSRVFWLDCPACSKHTSADGRIQLWLTQRGAI